MRVPTTAGFDPGFELLPHQEVKFDPVVVASTGFLYVWVSNESENTKVWFDDLTITHQQRIVTQATDYGPWGDVVREQKTNVLEEYRYGYQGQFAEKDEETGWSHFEAREYDPVIGRWMSVDPSRQFYSPFLGMGNSPTNGVDPDGRDWFKDPVTGEPVWLGATSTFTDNAGTVWEHISGSSDLLVVTHNRDFNDVIGAEPINSARFNVFDATINFFDPIGTITGNTVPAGQATGEVRPAFSGGQFVTIAEGIYPARDQFRGSKGPNDLSLIINEGGAIPTTPNSPRPYAYGIFLHWGNPNKRSLISNEGAGSQYSEGCLTTGCGENARNRHAGFFKTYLRNFHGEIWLRGR